MKKLLTVCLCLAEASLYAYNWKADCAALPDDERAFIASAVNAAAGNLPQLEQSFDQALDAGITVNELKELVLQTYAYTGFPRSFNAANTLERVVKTRQSQGKRDAVGEEPLSIPAGTDKYELGRQNLARLMGQDIPSRPSVFVQGTDTFLKEHLFADVFARGVLSNRQREMATVAFLVTLGNVSPQLESHMRLAIKSGVTPEQIRGICAIVKKQIGRKQAVNGLKVLQKVEQK